MVDFDRILTVKKAAQARLMRIPGVHAVGIGAKVVGGERTTEPAIIVFLVQKRAASEVRPEETVPAEIDGVKTDVIEAGIPTLHAALPDMEPYRDKGLLGGIQIQPALSIFGGTLGCIGATDEPDSKIVAITNQHVVSPLNAVPSKATLAVSAAADGHTITLSGTVTPILRVGVDLTILPSAGNNTFISVQYVTAAGDSLADVATHLATLINARNDPGINAATSNAQLLLTPAQGFRVIVANTTVDRFFGVVDNTRRNLTLMGTPDPGLLLFLRVATRTEVNGPVKEAEIYRITTPTDTLAGVATALAQEINSPVISGVPFTATASGAQLTIAGVLNTAAEIISCETFAARAPQAAASLKAAVTGTSITLSGRVSGNLYGVFVNVNVGGFEPTRGIFVAPRQGMDLNDLASSIVIELQKVQLPNVSVHAPGGARIEINGAEEVECLITSDIRVGQPNNNFPSACSDCANSRIGKILEARLDLDCALIELDPGMKYKNEVVEIGVVSDVHDVTLQEATSHTFAVEKRGRTSGHTNGIIQALDVVGVMANENRTFQRVYAGAMQIHSTTANPFAGEGDSGAAVLSAAHEVVGILFGGRGADTVATPIGPIREQMQVIVQTATTLGKVLTVPKASPHHAVAPSPTPSLRPEPLFRARLRERMREQRAEVATTPAGRRYSTLFSFFAPEVRWLIDTNRRVAAVWQRNGGPELVRAILAVLQQHDLTLPEEIEGRPISACVAKIQEALLRYGSPALAAAVRVHGPRIARLAGLNHGQALAALESRSE